MTSKKTVEAYLKNHPEWREELTALREILLKHDLEETIKWGMPAYMAHGKNVIGMTGFKTYFGLWFHQGAELKDKAGVLINAQEGKTKSLRQWRMTNAKDIKTKVISAYVREAIAVAKTSKPAAKNKAATLRAPPELKRAFTRNPDAEKAFKSLTPGKRRDYIDYITEAKRTDTKERRAAKILPMILSGVGLHDKYR